MAYAPFSNKVNPQTSALNSKMNPSPLQPLTKSSYGGGELMPAVGSSQYKQAQNLSMPTPLQTSAPLASSPVTTPKPTYSSLVGSLGNQDNSSYNQATRSSISGLQGIASTPNAGAVNAQSGLQNIAQNQTAGVVKAQDDYNKFAQSAPYMIAAQSNPNVAASIASGRSSLLGQTFGQVLGAKGQAVSNALGAQGQQITAGQAAGGLALDSQGQQINAGQAAGGMALSGQGTSQSALSSAAGYAAPQAYGLTTQPYNPLTDTFGGGGANGAIGRATQAANIGTAQDFTTNINNTQAMASSADANFDLLNSYATQGGASENAPILTALITRFGQTAQGNQAVAGFQAQLQGIRAAYSEITGGDAMKAIPDNITPAQLKQVQQALKSTAANKVEGYKQGLNNLQGGGSAAPKSSGGSGGLFDW